MLRAALVALPALLLIGACGGSRPAAQADAEKKFEQMLTNATLSGWFTRRGDQLTQERYSITGVTRMPGDIWLINTRIQYGSRDVTVPVPVKVLWAGDTPMITLTDLTIPKVGTFTARVVFYRDQYSGLWMNDKGMGGQMFGRIERNTAAPAATSAR